jgi:hypothetical protein
MDSKQDLKEEIAKVAYEISEQMGISGREVENWLEAERIVLERLSVREPSKVAKKLAQSRKKVERRRKEKCRERRSDNLPNTERHTLTTDSGGTNSRMERSRQVRLSVGSFLKERVQ